MVPASTRLLLPVDDSCSRIWMVVQGFISLWMVLYGVGWFWIVPEDGGMFLIDL